MGDRFRAVGRELGDRLRGYRESAGLTLSELGELVGRSKPHLHRIEKGEHAQLSELEVVHYLASCGVRYREVERVVDFCREANQNRPFWAHSVGLWMSDSLRALIFHESTATRIVDYAPEVIPGILQTEPYIQALFRREDIPDDQRQTRVQARLDRQKILFRNNPAKFTFIIKECALRLEVGDYRTMAEQLLAMLFFADQRNISIRVMPASARHNALFDGPFIYLDYDKFTPLVYVQAPLTGFFIEDPTMVSEHRPLLRHMATVALDEEESRALIARLADEYDWSEGSWDDRWRMAQEHL